MRNFFTLSLLLALASGVRAQSSHQQVAQALLEIHENGRAIHNEDHDYVGAYRMYQGGLMVARRMLSDRPDLQKVIGDGLAEAARETSVSRRAYRLHETIEAVRIELTKSGGKASEGLTIPPREVGSPTKTGIKPDPKPSATVTEVKGGVVGRVMWQGNPIEGVDVTFVTLDRQPPRVFETTTSAQGVYAVPSLPPGKYVVLITPGTSPTAKKLPERYATSTASPLRFEVKGGGEKLDFVLQ
jgi:Carboxypeptidase regulatory-like domain